MSYLDVNLTLLSRRQPELARLLRDTSAERVEIFRSAQGLPSALYRTASGPVHLHSRYDPLREARLTLKKLDLAGADYFILLGFGLGYLLDVLLEQDTDPDHRYFVVESDLQILRSAMEARDLQAILSLSHIYFAWPVIGPDLARQWQQFFDPVRAQKSVFITYSPCTALNPDLFDAALEVIQSQTFQIFTDINTLVAQSQAFLDNFVQNLRWTLRAPGVSEVAGRFSGIPAVLVSAGPSLDKNVHELRGCEDRVLLLSCDTTLKPLLSSGIQPHFVISGDPTSGNYLHLKGASADKTILVAEATAYPAVFEQFEGKTITCTFENSSLRPLTDLLAGKGTLRAWGSVATMALDFGILLGCNPIIFVGQDLAHTDGRTYCSGLYFESKWFSGIMDPEEYQKRWENLRSGKKVLAMQDVFGRPVETTDKLAAYWNWIAKELRSHPEIRFINATEGGILRDDVAILSLRDALHRHCREDRKLRANVGSLCRRAPPPDTQVTIELLADLKEESRNVAQSLGQGKQICGNVPRVAIQDLVKKLDCVKESIYENRRLAPLLDCFNQLGNVTFLRKQAGLVRRPIDASFSEALRNTYLKYFESVSQALSTLDSALARIERILSESQGNP